MTAPWEEDNEVLEIHLHADWCQPVGGEQCTCVPYIFMGDDERPDEEIDSAAKAHHSAHGKAN